MKVKTRFLFVQPETENIGIECLSAALKKYGFPVSLVYLPRPFDNIAFRLIKNKNGTDEEKVERKIRIFRPDIVCFSPFTSQYAWAVKQAKRIKQKFPKITILFGGVHVNSVPELVIGNNWVDAIVVGEGDEPIVQFGKYFKTKKLLELKSVWIKDGGKTYKNSLAILPKNLDELPMPDKDIFYDQIPKPLRSYSYVIMGSRGCPFACAYCSNNVYQKLYLGQNRLRFRSPENIIQELSEAKRKYGFKLVEFFDDVITIDEKRLRKLLKLYRQQINLPFTCYLHPQLASERIIQELKKAKCCWLKLGVQSANEDYRKKILHRYETNEEILKVCRWCHQYKLDFSLDHIINLPGETEEDLVGAVRLYNQCRPKIINFGSLIYLPKTDIIKQGLEEGIITKRDVKKINQGEDRVSRLANIDLFCYQYKKQKVTNISVIVMLLMLILITPGWFIERLLKWKIYQWKFQIPKGVLVAIKILTKIKVRQMYLYFSVLQTSAYYWLHKDKTETV
ncbi:MAG: radical SAM protein [Candidatus Shapirobacteria bacterium]|jgi:radical SAM superfamily enzyme YgiQ (UPF0313 family)